MSNTVDAPLLQFLLTSIHQSLMAGFVETAACLTRDGESWEERATHAIHLVDACVFAPEMNDWLRGVVVHAIEHTFDVHIAWDPDNSETYQVLPRTREPQAPG